MHRSFKLTVGSVRQELAILVRSIAGALRLVYLLILAIPTGIFLLILVNIMHGTGLPNPDLLKYITALVIGTFVVTIAVAAMTRRLQWLVGKESTRFYCWTTIGLFSVMALFYSVENWRGKRMWAEVERDLARHGDTLSSWPSSQIQEAQDMAKTAIFLPLTKIEIRSNGAIVPGDNDGFKRLRRIQLPISAPSLDAPWFRTDHFNFDRAAAILESKSKIRPNPDFEFPRQLPDLPDGPPEAVVLAYINSFAAELDQIREATRRTSSSLPCDQEVDRIMTRLGQVFAWRAAAELKTNQTNEALEDVRCALRLALANSGLHTYLAHRSGVFMLVTALQPAYDGMEAHQWSDAQLAMLQSELERFHPLADYEAVNRYCAWVNMDLMNEIVPISPVRPAPEWKEVKDAPGVKLVRLFYPKGWSFQNQAALYQLFRQASSAVDLDRQQISFEIISRKPPIQSLDPFLSGFMLQRAQFVTGELAQQAAMVQNGINLARTACALERFRLAEGHNPGKLEDLAPRFLDKAPHDLSGKPLNYSLTPNGNIKLHSGDWTWQYAQKVD